MNILKLELTRLGTLTLTLLSVRPTDLLMRLHAEEKDRLSICLL